MSAPLHPDVVLSRTADALEHQLALWKPSELARRIGAGRTSISRDWQADLSAWPWSKGIRFCCADPTLKAEHIAALTGAPEILPAGTPARAVRDLASRFAAEINRLLERSADDNITPIERAETEAELDALAVQITQLRALLRSQGNRR